MQQTAVNKESQLKKVQSMSQGDGSSIAYPPMVLRAHHRRGNWKIRGARSQRILLQNNVFHIWYDRCPCGTQKLSSTRLSHDQASQHSSMEREEACEASLIAEERLAVESYWIREILYICFMLCQCFSYMCNCPSCACLVLKETIKGHWIPQNWSYRQFGTTTYMVAGDWTRILWKSRECCSPLSHCSSPDVCLFAVFWPMSRCPCSNA